VKAPVRGAHRLSQSRFTPVTFAQKVLDGFLVEPAASPFALLLGDRYELPAR
jgi:hypothetical protein